MPFLVCMGATLQCSFGVATSALTVLPQNRLMVPTPAANIMDYAPMPCIPVTVTPWAPGSPPFLIGGDAGFKRCFHIDVHLGWRDPDY